MYEIYIEIIIIAILILFNAYLSMAEIAIVSSKKITLQKMEREGEQRAHIILNFLDDPNEFLSLGKATPFENEKLFGRCVLTVCNGKAVYSNKINNNI